MIERLLRWTAIAIAGVAFIDPQLTLSGSSRPRVSVITSGGGELAESTRHALRRSIGGRFETVDGLDSKADALVVIGDRYPERPIGEDAKVSTVTLGPVNPPSVFIRHVSAPRSVPPATAVRLGVDVQATEKRGARSELLIRTGGALVARRVHTWSSQTEVWHEDLDLVPVGEGPFVFDVHADSDQATVVVDRAPRLRVLVVESRPSWSSAFVRRALEADSRFEVSGVSAPLPGKLVTSGATPELAADLRAVDAVVLGGLDRLSAANLAVVERFARLRGGTVVLVPDGTIPAPVIVRLLPGAMLHETLLERSADLDAGGAPRLQASELLELSSDPGDVEIIARSAASRKPVVWSVPIGDGQVVVSGALDAWRYRGAADGAFERFWRSLVSGAALSARPAVEVTLSPASASPGDVVRIVARVRSLERDQQADRLEIGARVNGEPVRLWPDASSGVFVGSFVVDSRSTAVTRPVTVALADGGSGSANLVVSARAHGSPASGPPLSWLARTHGGIDVGPSSLQLLENHLRRSIVPTSHVAVRHPMRSPLWFVPFAVCLSAEWWLRRRRGAR